MNSTTKTRNAVFAVCSMLALFSSAFAGEPGDQVRSQTVKFADLNTGTPAGVEALYKRIHFAAQDVCSVSGTRDLGSAMSAATCAKESEARAIKRVNLPSLTAYYQMKTGGHSETLAAKR